jgi:hypothetical protein
MAFYFSQLHKEEKTEDGESYALGSVLRICFCLWAGSVELIRRIVADTSERSVR